MYYHNSNFQNFISKFRSASYYNFKNKFLNMYIHDFSSTMMAVYPDGVVGIISIDRLSSSLSWQNIKNFENNSKLKVSLKNNFTQLAPKKSNSELSIKSAPGDFSTCYENTNNKFETFWKQGDKCFAPYINGDVSFNYNIYFKI